MQAEGLAAAARRIEATMMPRLRELQAQFPAVGDIRGRGAMLAVELVTDPERKTPDPVLTAAVASACHRQGLIVLTAGSYGNVLRFLPPLVIGEQLLTEGMDVLSAAFAATASST